MTRIARLPDPYSRIVSGLRTWVGPTLGALTPEDRDVARGQHDLLVLRQREHLRPVPAARPARESLVRRAAQSSTPTSAPCPPTLDCGPGTV